MFKTIPIIVMAMLCLNFSTKAQENKAIDITATGIQIGQKVPDITITNLHNYKDKNGKPATTAKLSDFKGKLLILDFWATWCSPCIAMIPKMDSLQKQFGDKIQFLSVTYQNEKEVLPFLAKFEKQKNKHYDLPQITGDTILRKLFPHRTIPHYVWIDPEGRVMMLTNYWDISAQNLLTAIEGRTNNAVVIKQDKETTYDLGYPYLLAGNGGNGDNMLYHSVITRYTEGLPGMYTVKKSNAINGRRITMTNVPLTNLFAYIYGERKTLYNYKRILILSKDSTRFECPKQISFQDWIINNGFCYELIVPENIGAELFSIAKNDLQRFFPQYIVCIEPQKQMCMSLIRTSEIDNIKSKGGKVMSDFSPLGFNLNNFSLKRLTAQLNTVYMQNSPFWIVDETDYGNSVDILIEADLRSFESLNEALNPYGLQFVQKEILVDMLVIRDSGKPGIL